MQINLIVRLTFRLSFVLCWDRISFDLKSNNIHKELGRTKNSLHMRTASNVVLMFANHVGCKLANGEY